MKRQLQKLIFFLNYTPMAYVYGGPENWGLIPTKFAWDLYIFPLLDLVHRSCYI